MPLLTKKISNSNDIASFSPTLHGSFPTPCETHPIHKLMLKASPKVEAALPDCEHTLEGLSNQNIGRCGLAINITIIIINNYYYYYYNNNKSKEFNKKKKSNRHHKYVRVHTDFSYHINTYTIYLFEICISNQHNL